MPFQQFDRTRLKTKPISERIPAFTQADMIDPNIPVSLDHTSLNILADRIRKARDRRSTILWMLGASVIHNGNAPHLIRLMKEGYVNHFALNGAAAFQDFELAMVGGTMEDMVKNVGKGQFGLWTETGDCFNKAIQEGARDDLGFGEALGRMIGRENFPYKENSLLWNAYKLQVPLTVHIVFGCDTYQELASFDAASAGETTYADFLSYTQSIMNLEGGVFCDFGSRTIGPEVYLKALAMTRNVKHQRGGKIANFTTSVLDVLPLEGQNVHEAPSKSDPRYYFRPWKTILARTVADGGESYYVAGDDRIIVPALAQKIWND
jgi:Uncharacterized conserved protein